jgi:RNA polymerase sigma factor (sigma-70 family)
MTMTKEKLLNDLYTSKSTDKVIHGFTSDPYYKEELKQELFVILVKKRKSILLRLVRDKKIESYIYGIVARMFNSNTHEFARKIKTPRHSSIEDCNLIDSLEDTQDNTEELITNAEQAVKKLSAPDKVVFDFLYQGLNIKQIAERTGINRQYVSDTIKRIRSELQSQIRKDL